MVDKKKHRDCSGCSACSEVCGQKAITMVPDILGFKYPRIDGTKCTECGLCEKVCPFTKVDYIEAGYPKLYISRHKDPREVRKSQSGAAFMAIAEFILAKGGYVYGVGFKEHFVVSHKKATTMNDVQEFRGSKYVQSDTDGIFTQVIADLKQGREILFVGTPCQVAGLKACVPIELQKKLLSVDIICHGVSSPAVWKDYILDLEKRKGDKLVGVNFRDKEEFSWRHSSASYHFSKKPNKKQFFLGVFSREVLFRESCGNCPFSDINRPGDLTIGDYWGKIDSIEWQNIEDGCSTLIINNDKGKTAFESMCSLEYKAVSLEDAMQYNLEETTPENPYRMAFEREYARNGFHSAMKKYHDFGWKKRLRMWVGSLKRRLLKE